MASKRGNVSQVGRPFYTDKYKKYHTKVCDCGCNETYVTSQKLGTTKAGHQFRKAEFRKKTSQGVKDSFMRLGPLAGRNLIPEKARMEPTVDKAREMKPTECGKCGSQALEENSIHELMAKGNGHGLGWRCFMCGWVAWAFEADPDVKNGVRQGGAPKYRRGAHFSFRKLKKAGRPEVYE